ncbi:hypothetical protein LTR86_003501 [Recurvomyces mirabilis]|nr:hypothetical protein LTR86_003501 [Recurvomyces mirabilis]
MLEYLPPVFTATAVIFAVLSIFTGAQGIFDPVGFATSFGLPLDYSNIGKSFTTASGPEKKSQDTTLSYISLMSVRQLFTGIILGVFAYQNKWTEVATMLAVMGFLVAGTDGVFIYHSGKTKGAVFHALPGAVIAGLAIAFLLID